ncbi:tyrosyl-DNA phosphodiesterase 1 [Lasiodiplodia theobromae]|nr:tyrosyl-DNA phosphodiesterase 1 [Lasiodiplodia theobromae]
MWQFNYMFDMDLLMSSLDEDVRRSMRVKVIHGSWRREDVQRQMLEEWAKQYPNLEVIQAYMPEAFGTHHSKMMILIRADDSAQVVIHTANMIAKDWTNMTNAVWRSPLLPLLPENTSESTAGNNANESGNIKYPIGTGQRFKVDLLRYLSAYGKRLAALTKQLVRYDFSAIRAALVASVPRRVKLDDRNPDEQTSWGWVGLREVLSQIPLTSTTRPSKGMTVAQVSSIATLDQAGAWLEHFRSILESSKEGPSPTFSSLSTTSSTKPANALSSFQKASNLLRPSSGGKATPPDFRIIFPSVTDVRTALDGYRAGGSIHFKTQSAAQRKQLAYMRPDFCRWNTSKNPMTALRSSAAPHVKTYVRYATTARGDGTEQTTIDWAMLTSANLSTQAWGALPAAVKIGDGEAKKGRKDKQDGENGKEVRICSWEIGVVVWPALLAEGEERKEAVMLPVFGRDMPEVDNLRSDDVGGEKVVVGWRMPYDLPLTPYAENEEPWSATARYDEPDVKGCVWPGF